MIKKTFHGYSKLLVIIIASHTYILAKLRFFPYPELFIYSYLTDKGMVPYKQILDQHFPGAMVFPMNLSSLGIDTPSEARIIHLGLVIVSQLLLFIVARKLFGSEKKAILANLLYLLWQPFYEGHVMWIDSFMPPLLLFALYLSLSKSTKRNIFFSGLILSVSLLFKQVIAPLVIALSIYYLVKLRSIKKIFPFFLGVIIPQLFLVFWIIETDILYDFIYWTFTFNMTTFSEMGRKLPDFPGLLKTMPVFAVGFLSFLYYYYKKQKVYNTLLLGIFFLGGLAFSYARFDFIHLQPALPFAIIFITMIFVAIPNHFRKPVLFLYLLTSLYLIMPNIRYNLGNDIHFFGEREEKLILLIEEYVEPGNSVFALGTTPHLYYLTNTMPPGNIFVFQFPWFMVVAEDRIFQGIISDPPKVVVRDLSATTSGMNLVSYMPKISEHIDVNYKVVKTVDSIEIMIPK